MTPLMNGYSCMACKNTSLTFTDSYCKLHEVEVQKDGEVAKGIVTITLLYLDN